MQIEKIKLNTKDDTATVSPRWWNLEGDERAASLKQVIHGLHQDDALRQRASIIYARLYQTSQLGVLHRYAARSNSAQPGEERGSPIAHKVTFNVVKSCIDTACAKVSKNRPRASFVTDNGNWETKRRAKGLTSYVDGLFYQTDLYAKTEDVFRDSGIFGSGAILLSVDEKEGTIHAERALSIEFSVDEHEAIYGKPRTLYRETPKAKDELRALYGDTPAKLFAIDGAKGETDMASASRPATSEMVTVTEAWHLPSCKGAKDGVHVIAVDGCVLLEEPWPYQWFPVFFFHWSMPVVGMWGCGIAEELAGIQLEISKTLRTIQRAQHLAGSFRVYVEQGANVKVAHLTNDDGQVVTYRGTKPIFDAVSNTVPPELYSHLENLVNKSYALIGVSQLSASAKKPAGLDAGVAIREMYDIESERFVKIGQRWERFHVDIARAMVELTAALYERKPHLKVAAPGTKFLKTIKWADVRLKEDEFEMRPFPTSSLPTTPAYRFQQIVEWKKAGIVDQEQMMQLLDMPDLEQFTSLYTASINDIERCLDAIVERGDYQAPEPFMDLKRCVKMALSTLLKGREDGLSERRQELLLRWMDEAKSLSSGPAPTIGTVGAAPQPDPTTGVPGMVPDAPLGVAPLVPPTSSIPALPTDVAAVPPSVAAMPEQPLPPGVA